MRVFEPRFFAVWGVVAVCAASAGAQASRPALVGARTRIDQLVLPAPEVVAKPIDAKSPIVLRIVAVYPHGTDFRYDFEFEGLEPGGYDLRDWLVRKDGTPATGLPPALGVEIRSAAPPGKLVPHAPVRRDAPSVGGYRTWMVFGGVVWALGLVAFLVLGRKRRAAAAAAGAPPASLAERLRPLVDAAARGALPGPERARLELGLTALWKKRLGLDDLPPDELYARLRAHAEAGPLLRGLEEWLHAPATAVPPDVGALLAPYRALKASDWDAATG